MMISGHQKWDEKLKLSVPLLKVGRNSPTLPYRFRGHCTPRHTNQVVLTSNDLILQTVSAILAKCSLYVHRYYDQCYEQQNCTTKSYPWSLDLAVEIYRKKLQDRKNCCHAVLCPSWQPTHRRTCSCSCSLEAQVHTHAAGRRRLSRSPTHGLPSFDHVYVNGHKTKDIYSFIIWFIQEKVKSRFV